jgi:hypothetical protein
MIFKLSIFLPLKLLTEMTILRRGGYLVASARPSEAWDAAICAANLMDWERDMLFFPFISSWDFSMATIRIIKSGYRILENLSEERVENKN